MSTPNILLIMADEFRRDALGCYGHPVVETPNLDRLAARGTRFTQAYTPSPICVPARASLATGQYACQSGYWCNALPYTGTPPGWAHELRAAGHDVVSIGKLHYRSTDDDNGFSEEILPMHVHDGVGWIRGLLRSEDLTLDNVGDFARQIGAGSDPYTDYDNQVADRAEHWIRERRADSGPWTTFVSFVRPHYPLTCPEEYLSRYPVDRMTLPKAAPAGGRPNHPVLAGMRDYACYDDYFTDETRLLAIASYYGLCTMIDDYVGRLLDALDDSGLSDDTLVMFVSDHGESLGDRGFWTKCTMYEESVVIPMIVAGPNVAKGAVRDDPVSLIDVRDTLIDAAGLDRPSTGSGSISLLDPALADPERPVFSEYHDGGSITGMFMLRQGRWKYIVYPGYDDQLFDLHDDPDEDHDLGSSPETIDLRAGLRLTLNQFCDPDNANRQAFDDQNRRIETLGGKDAILNTQVYDHTPVPTDILD